MSLALITGVNGQDGSYLAEFLLDKGYRIVGTVRDRQAISGHIAHLRRRIEIVELNLCEADSFETLLDYIRPDEIYNLAARALGSELWTSPTVTGEINGLAVTRILEAIKKVGPKIRFCQASSSEVFGNSLGTRQDESSIIRPRNPYGAAKAYAQWIVANYRDTHGLFACSCILFNHESPRRSLEFVTRKISHTVASIALGLARELCLGDLDSVRDWGFAGDYVIAMWLMLQQSVPDDYVIATGEAHSVRELCEVAFSHVGLKYEDYVVQDKRHFRPAEKAVLIGNPAKAERVLGWRRTITFDALVRMMVDADIALLQSRSNESRSTEGKTSDPSESTFVR